MFSIVDLSISLTQCKCGWVITVNENKMKGTLATYERSTSQMSVDQDDQIELQGPKSNIGMHVKPFNVQNNLLYLMNSRESVFSITVILK